MANNTIDTLDIKIKSSSDEAIKNLDSLIERLKVVQHSTNKISGKSIANIGKGTASNLNKSATASKNLSINLSSLPKQILGLNTNFGKFAQVAGSFYANCFLITRGIKKIGNAVNSAMDYVETYNYFNVTMDKIGKQFGKQYSEYGYNSAEEYANSFKSRLTDLMTKMTGYEVGDGGELKRSTTQTQNLSLDPEQLMNYQAKVAAVSNSVGMLGENSISTAKALSMLSADLSSLTNVPIESVMTNLQSGLIGQSRALYKYGIDITNNTLQELADANAIAKKVSAMSQSEKMQLRVLAILQQSKIAWGDQANTINSVANQYRIFGQQTQNLSRILGNLFLPIVQYALPYINGMVIALQKLFETIGFKLWGDNWLTEVMDGISGGASDIDGLYDSIEDVGDATDDASKKAKKLKDNLNTLAIDKLNIISPKDKKSSKDEDGGTFDLSNQIGKAVSDYEKVWNKALKNSRNKAQEIANAIISAFQKGDYQGIGKYISNGLTKSLESIPWNTIYQKVGSFGTGLAQFLNGLITPELFYEVGRNIAKFLGLRVEFALNFFKELDWSNVGESIANGLNGFLENYPWADTAEALNKFVDGFEKALGSFISNINYKSVFKAFFDFFGNLEIDTILVIPMLKAFLKIKRGASTTFSSVGDLIGTALSGAARGIVNLKDNIKVLGGKDGIRYTFLQGKDGIDNFRNGLTNTQKAIVGTGGIIAAFAGVKKAFQGVNDGSKTLLDGLGQIAISAGISASALYVAFGPAGIAMAAVSILAGAIGGIYSSMEKDRENFEKENNRALDDLTKRYSDFQKMRKDGNENFAKNTAEIDHAKELSDELDKIVDKNGKIKKGYEKRAKVIVDQINQALGTEYKITDGILEKNKDIHDEINKIVYTKKLQILMDSKKDEYTTALTKKAGMKKSMTDASFRYRTLKHERDDTKSEMDAAKSTMNYWKELGNTTTPEYNQAVADYIRYSKVLKEQNKNLKTYSEEFDTARTAYIEYCNTITNYDNAISASAEGNSKKVEKAFNNLLNNADTWSSKVGDNIMDGMTKGISESDVTRPEKEYKKKIKSVTGEKSGIVKTNVQRSIEKGFAEGAQEADVSEARNFFKEKMRSIFNIQSDFAFQLGFSFKDAQKNKNQWLNKEFANTLKNNDMVIKTKFKPIGYKANGGMVRSADLFYANENGNAELIGRYGNQTGVANQGQIVDAIEEASYRGHMRALASVGASQDQVIENHLTVELDGDVVAKKVSKANARNGAQIIGNQNGYVFG